MFRLQKTHGLFLAALALIAKTAEKFSIQGDYIPRDYPY